jgi:predicted porin
MGKHSIVAGVVGLALAGAAAAQSSVSLYGAVDMGMEWKKTGAGSSIRQIPGGTLGSRIGFRGEEDLGGGYKARFRLETGFRGDTGALTQGGRAFGRGANIELAHRDYGSVMMGRVELPYYQAQLAVDAFAWKTNGGLLAVNRNGSATQQLIPLVVSARADQAMAYVSPTWGGLQFRGLFTMRDDAAGQGNATSASLRYRAHGIDGVAAFARQKSAANGSGSVDAFVLGGSYQLPGFKLFAGLTNEKNDCTTCTGSFKLGADVRPGRASEFRMLNLGASTAFGAYTVYAQVTRVTDRTDYRVATGSRDATWLAVGGEYALSKRTALYGSVGTITNRNGSNYTLGSGTSQQPANAIGPNNPRASAAVVGVRHFF